MLHIVKLVSFIIFCRHIFIYCDDETIDQLVGDSSDGFSSDSEDISINVKWKHGDAEFKYKKNKISGQNWHCYDAISKLITSVYYDDLLIWKSDPGTSCKSVRANLPSCGKNTIVVQVGSEDKTFIEEYGFYHEHGTVALDVDSKSSASDYNFILEGRDRDGKRIYKAKEGKKITLIVKKNSCGKNKLFWKATGSWYCTEVKLTRVSGENKQMDLKLTDGTTSTDLVLVKQDEFWVHENTIYLNTKDKDKAYKCKYTSQIQNNKGQFTYEPDGVTITRVSHGDHKPDNLIWQSSGTDYCTKVTGNVEKGKTVSYDLELKDDGGRPFTLKSEMADGKWHLSSI